MFNFCAFSQNCCGDNFLKFPLKSISNYCQNEPETLLTTAILSYDKEYRLVKYSTFQGPTIISEIVYKYNESGQLVAKEIYSANEELTLTSEIVYKYNELGQLAAEEFYSVKSELTLDRTKLYKYDEKNRLIYEGYDDDNSNNTKNNYCYNAKGQLISSTEDCNYTHSSYLYRYDSKGRLINKYLNDNLICSYVYYEDRLIKELGTQNNETTYEYDDNGSMLIKKISEKIVEQNYYYQDRLVERWTFYYGIDPGYYPCSGQNITKYEYY
jgi:YD repeat-containing protein